MFLEKDDAESFKFGKVCSKLGQQYKANILRSVLFYFEVLRKLLVRNMRGISMP